MPIEPLPQFEADLAEHLAERADREAYERLNAPKTVVVRFGVMKLVGEYRWNSSVKPGCGSRLVVRTHRGTELGTMLTSTCPNSGCSKSVSRKEMLDYIQNSGGRDYPFFTRGEAIRVATGEDLKRQERHDAEAAGMRKRAHAVARGLGLPIKIVDAETVLGGELVTYYYHAEERVDHRALFQELRSLHDCRVDLKHVGARDEARITADYERCGQYCCCKNFLKVLKPVSMKAAKIQKQTLDPLKISGRCGRLMCCLRYEDQTYDELRKNLPRRGARVGTPAGDGEVVETQILTQLALVHLPDGTRQAFPIEDLTPPGQQPPPKPAETDAEDRPRKRRRRGKRPDGSAPAQADGGPDTAPDTAAGDAPAPTKKKRRRRRKKPQDSDSAKAGAGSAPESSEPSPRPPQDGPEGEAAPKKKRRRRRRKPPTDGAGPAGPAGD